MAEEIDFNFRGKLADNHTLDFYEAGRFQYGASRLMVKLDQFRRTGRFSKRITYDNNTRILLETQEDGSFLISTLVPFLQAGGTAFLSTSLSSLWSYVADRVLSKSDTETIQQALESQAQLAKVFGEQMVGQANQNQQTLEMLQERIETGDHLTNKSFDLYERLLAERERSTRLERQLALWEQITPEQDAELISMATPLLKDMGRTLKNSASSLTIYASDNDKRTPIVFIDKKMASEIDTTRFDDKATLILVRIIQYNIETGWGKLRTEEAEGLLSFNVPSDRRGDVQAELLDAMDRAGNDLDTYVEALFVRSNSGVLKRMIVLNIHDLDEIERNT